MNRINRKCINYIPISKTCLDNEYNVNWPYVCMSGSVTECYDNYRQSGMTPVLS